MSLVKLNTRPCLILIGCLKYLLGVLYHESFGKHCHGKVTIKGTFNMLLQSSYYTAINGVLLWSVRFLRYNF